MDGRSPESDRPPYMNDLAICPELATSTSPPSNTTVPPFQNLHFRLGFEKYILLVAFSILHFSGAAQTVTFDKKSFFNEDQVLQMTLVTDLRKLVNDKAKDNYEHNIQPATISFMLPDSSRVEQVADIRPRGDFRRLECYMPPIKINFKTTAGGPLKKLGALKLVWPCDNSPYYEQLVLKEYLVYRMYAMITDMSFRVRLVKLECRDIKDRVKTHNTYGFFIEDIDQVAKRNDCIEVDSLSFYSEQTNRVQTTLATLFQYMIGNTDWGIPVYHNIKLIQTIGDSLSYPFVVPFDFDCSGIVNANYALPDPELDITNVRQRAYRGFPRTFEELEGALDLLRARRDAFESLIRNCPSLTDLNKKDMLSYIGEFYRLTADESTVKILFIKQARTR
jgi:hypothetical protein